MYSAPYGAYPSTAYYSYTWEPSPQPQYYAPPTESRPSRSRRRATVTGESYSIFAGPHGERYYAVPEETVKRSSSSRHHRSKHEKSSRRHERRSSRTATSIPATYQSYQDAAGNVYYYATTEQEAPRRDTREYEQEDTAYGYKYRTSPPPQEYHRHTRQSHSYSNYAEYSQEPASHERSESPRRTSSARHSKSRGSKSSREPRVATDSDRRRARIPAGFSMTNWDPTEVPLLLAGSVFDANSLGKWIYDWTAATHGAAAPLTELAGDLWILLIQLSGKIKRGEERVRSVRHREDREIVEDSLDDGDKHWQRLKKLLKICEEYMLKKSKSSSRSGSKKILGDESGRAFVKCIFGRDKELERTEKYMAGIRHWSARFDADCDDILRRGS